MFKKVFIWTGIIVTFSALTVWAATITTVTKSPDPVGKYEKFELTVALGSTYTNPYDPTQIDLSATFTSPSGKAWKVNGFYNGAQGITAYKIRFAANETGNWTYVVSATDAGGTATQSPGGTFTVTASNYHGWVHVAPNNRYLCQDDGTSFFGVGSCCCWGVTTAYMNTMQQYKWNTWFYWNGTYDGSGGNNLIESMSSGIGKYDQSKSARIDTLLAWSEARGLTMVLVVWPHDYLASAMPGSWSDKWSSNPYSSIVSCANFYSDATSWSYQQKQYRYIIARWGYSRALGGWQTVDEIQGTDGASGLSGSSPVTQPTAAWIVKIGDFFHTNDPFKHPTDCSGYGANWTAANQANDMTNVETYGGGSATGEASTCKSMWNQIAKPCMSGESGSDSAHVRIWASFANGIAMTPMMWQLNQGLSTTALQAFPPFASFIADIDFAHYTNLTQATVTVSGSTGYGIKCDQGAYGWMAAGSSGKTLSVAGLPNKTFSLVFFDCTAGTVLSTNSVTVTNGTLTATVPTSASDIAFKALTPVQVIARSAPKETRLRPMPNIAYENGALVLRNVSMDENSLVDITTALGSAVARYKVTDAKVTMLPIKRLGQGVYFAGFSSGKNKIFQRIVVK
jgi:hypothetical protein